jgi:predicted transcriptional regulator
VAAIGVREELHRLADELPEDAAREVLEYARFVQALENAPEDDEPETPEEAAAVAEAMEDLRAGRVVPWEQVRARYLRQP